LAIQAPNNVFLKGAKLAISDYLDPKLITFLDADSRDSAMRTIVDLVAKESDHIDDAASFYQAIIDREKVVSTGVGMGVAVPHAKLATCHNFFVTIGILKKGVDWDAIDGAPVRLIFMIGGPDDKPTEYLQILSTLTMAMKDEERRKKMLQSKDPAAIMELFRNF